MRERQTFVKLAVVIVACWTCASALLAIRQLRLQAVYEMAEARSRILRDDDRLWRLRAQIATLVTPDRINTMVERIESGPNSEGTEFLVNHDR